MFSLLVPRVMARVGGVALLQAAASHLPPSALTGESGRSHLGHLLIYFRTPPSRGSWDPAGGVKDGPSFEHARAGAGGCAGLGTATAAGLR